MGGDTTKKKNTKASSSATSPDPSSIPRTEHEIDLYTCALSELGRSLEVDPPPRS